MGPPTNSYVACAWPHVSSYFHKSGRRVSIDQLAQVDLTGSDITVWHGRPRAITEQELLDPGFKTEWLYNVRPRRMGRVLESWVEASPVPHLRVRFTLDSGHRRSDLDTAYRIRSGELGNVSMNLLFLPDPANPRRERLVCDHIALCKTGAQPTPVLEGEFEGRRELGFSVDSLLHPRKTAGGGKSNAMDVMMSNAASDSGDTVWYPSFAIETMSESAEAPATTPAEQPPQPEAMDVQAPDAKPALDPESFSRICAEIMKKIGSEPELAHGFESMFTTLDSQLKSIQEEKAVMSKKLAASEEQLASNRQQAVETQRRVAETIASQIADLVQNLPEAAPSRDMAVKDGISAPEYPAKLTAVLQALDPTDFKVVRDALGVVMANSLESMEANKMLSRQVSESGATLYQLKLAEDSRRVAELGKTFALRLNPCVSALGARPYSDLAGMSSTPVMANAFADGAKRQAVDVPAVPASAPQSHTGVPSKFLDTFNRLKSEEFTPMPFQRRV